MVIQHVTAYRSRDGLDALIAAQEAAKVGPVEDPFHAGQTKRSASHHYRPSQRNRMTLGCNRLILVLRDQLSQLRVSGRRDQSGRGLCGARRHRTYSGGVQATDGLIDRHAVRPLGVVREQREYTGVVAEHVFDETVQRLLRSDLDEHPHALLVQSPEALHELDWGRHLPAQDFDHLRLRTGTHRIEVPAHVGHNRNLRRSEMESSQRLSQWGRRRSNDRGVKGVADGQGNHLMARTGERSHGFLDSCGGTSDDCLMVAVYVRDDDIAVDARNGALDFSQRREHRSHSAAIIQHEVCHLPAAGAHGLQRVGERQRAGRHQSRVLAKAVAHHEIGVQALLRQEPGEGPVDREHRRLGDLGPA